MPQQRKVFMNSDGRGIVLLSVAVYSLLKNNDPTKHIDLYIAHDRSFAEADGLSRIRDIVGRFPFSAVHFLDCGPLLDKYGAALDNGTHPLMLWAFPLCTEILPPDIGGQIVYIDIDMLICRDLEPLFSLDLSSGNFVAAAVNESRREHRKYLVDAGWPEEAGYSFNNATCVLDLDVCRREHIADQLVSWYLAHKDIAVNLDQDSQNVVYGARTLRLPIKWNYTDGWLERILKMNPFAAEWRVFPPEDVLSAILEPAIIHYIGRKKPTSWTHRPERRAFRQALSELGLLENGRLPGETNLRILVGWLFDGYHLVLKEYARLLLFVRRLCGLGRAASAASGPSAKG